MGKIKHFMYVPFTGLGLYGGMRGERWLKNRIQIFKQFVVPSLLNQINQDFIVWVSWRPDEETNPQVIELKKWLDQTRLTTVFTFHGLCFWDDKYPDEAAATRLTYSLIDSLEVLRPIVGDSDQVLMTIQPSDDLYNYEAVDMIQRNKDKGQVLSYQNGYICDYTTKEISEYNPKTHPPFYTIVFPADKFLSVKEHMQYTGPYKSHEYVVNYLKDYQLTGRGYLVGTHGENVSTYYDHPYKGSVVPDGEWIQNQFGIMQSQPASIGRGWKRNIFHKLPHKVQRKIRYILGEQFYAKIYDFIRA